MLEAAPLSVSQQSLLRTIRNELKPHLGWGSRADNRQKHYGHLPVGSAARDDAFVNAQLRAIVPSEKWMPDIEEEYRAKRQRDGEREANIHFMRLADETVKPWRLPLSASDSDVADAGGECATLVSRAAEASLRARPHRTAVAVPPVLVAQLAAEFARTRGIEPPPPDTPPLLVLKKLSREKFWRRRLLTAHRQQREAAGIFAGRVSVKHEVYVTDDSVYSIRRRNEKCAAWLEDSELENELGERVSMADIAKSSLANPKNGLAQFCVVVKGGEVAALQRGFIAQFVTLTCPIAFHARKYDGRKNPKHTTATPLDGHRHLMANWKLVRSRLKYRGIEFFGCRVQEPHHDGTPHMHMLVFVHPRHVRKFNELIREYFLNRHNPDEKGARSHRIKIERIDPKKGSALGYLLKYLAKTFDGAGLDVDRHGLPGDQAAERQVAWSRTWRIRQRQTFGLPSVTLWRELYRLQPNPLHPAPLTAAHAARLAGDFGKYIAIQGGPCVSRSKRPIHLAKTERGTAFDGPTGSFVFRTDTYGEPAAPSIYGIAVDGGETVFPTRVHRWTLVRAAGENQQRTGRKAGVPWTRRNNCTPEQIRDFSTPNHPVAGLQFDPESIAVRHPAAHPTAPPPGALP